MLCNISREHISHIFISLYSYTVRGTATICLEAKKTETKICDRKRSKCQSRRDQVHLVVCLFHSFVIVRWKGMSVIFKHIFEWASPKLWVSVHMFIVATASLPANLSLSHALKRATVTMCESVGIYIFACSFVCWFVCVRLQSLRIIQSGNFPILISWWKPS